MSDPYREPLVAIDADARERLDVLGQRVEKLEKRPVSDEFAMTKLVLRGILYLAVTIASGCLASQLIEKLC